MRLRRSRLRPIGASVACRAPQGRAIPRCSLGGALGFNSLSLHQAQKKPTLSEMEVGFCHRLVEAGGVEPPSEDSLLRATTRVSGHLILVPGDPGRQGSLRTIPA